jgi:hypothetical protein
VKPFKQYDDEREIEWQVYFFGSEENRDLLRTYDSEPDVLEVSADASELGYHCFEITKRVLETVRYAVPATIKY